MMDTKEFKELFNEVAQYNNFEKAFGGWFKESHESIVVLDLQKSNYGCYYELNIKIYIQGVFNKAYVRNKDLVKKNIGNIFSRQPNEYKDMLELDNLMSIENRRTKLESLFDNYIVPITTMAATKEGIMRMSEEKKIFILPAVMNEIKRLMQ